MDYIPYIVPAFRVYYVTAFVYDALQGCRSSNKSLAEKLADVSGSSIAGYLIGTQFGQALIWILTMVEQAPKFVADKAEELWNDNIKPVLQTFLDDLLSRAESLLAGIPGVGTLLSSAIGLVRNLLQKLFGVSGTAAKLIVWVLIGLGFKRVFLK